MTYRINTVLRHIKVYSNTIELTVHTSCYCVLDLLCVIMNDSLPKPEKTPQSTIVKKQGGNTIPVPTIPPPLVDAHDIEVSLILNT